MLHIANNSYFKKKEKRSQENQNGHLRVVGYIGEGSVSPSLEPDRNKNQKGKEIIFSRVLL